MTWKFNKDGWTNWIEHDGNGCPCVGWWVMCEFVGNDVLEGVATNSHCWSCSHDDVLYNPIIRYRIRKPKGADILERIANMATDYFSQRAFLCCKRR